MSFWDQVEPYWELITAGITILGPILSLATIGWILVAKKNPTSAVAWCLLVFMLPLIGPLFFLLFGYQHVSRPLSRKRRHRQAFMRKGMPPIEEAAAGDAQQTEDRGPATSVQAASSDEISRLARRFGASPVSTGNDLVLYHEDHAAFAGMLEAIGSAKHPVHLETFIFRPDATRL